MPESKEKKFLKIFGNPQINILSAKQEQVAIKEEPSKKRK